MYRLTFIHKRCTVIALLLIVVAVVALAVALTFCHALRTEEEGLYKEDFDDESAQDWELEEGWLVDGGVLRGSNHNLARYTASEWDDSRVRFWLWIEENSTIYFNYRLSEKGRYLIAFHSEGINLSKESSWGTLHEELAISYAPIPTRIWHSVEIVGVGPRIQIFLDDTLELDYTDSEPLLNGTIAFEIIKGEAAVDDLVVIWSVEKEEYEELYYFRNREPEEVVPPPPSPPPPVEEEVAPPVEEPIVAHAVPPVEEAAPRLPAPPCGGRLSSSGHGRVRSQLIEGAAPHGMEPYYWNAEQGAPPPVEEVAPPISKIVEDELSKLELGQLLFNPPQEMTYLMKERIEVRISKNIEEDLTKGLRGRGVPQTEIIKVGTFMKARLMGDNFDIEEISDPIQPVTCEDFTQWEWDVMPLKRGNQTIKLSVSVVIMIPDAPNDITRCYPVYERLINVKVNPFIALKFWISSYWQWIITIIIGSEITRRFLKKIRRFLKRW